jgi:hypothetical protein
MITGLLKLGIRICKWYFARLKKKKKKKKKRNKSKMYHPFIWECHFFCYLDDGK